jgi:predicted Fe-Mo cluster-binding NifX family protein
MRVVVSSYGADIDGPLSPTFGRCPVFLFIETDSMEFEAAPNPGLDAPGGAGVEAAQFVTSRGIEAVITGRVGPKAMNVLETAGTPVFLTERGTVRQAVEDFRDGELSSGSERSTRANPAMTSATGRTREQSPIASVGDKKRTMRVAFSADDEKGLESTVSHHFGRCPYYVLVDIEQGEPTKVKTVENPHFGNHQPGQVPRFIESLGAQVIVSGGMGRRALGFFEVANIEPVTQARGTVGEVLQQYLGGVLAGAEPCRESVRHEQERPGDPPPRVGAGDGQKIQSLQTRIEVLEHQLQRTLNLINPLKWGGSS